MDDAGRSLAGTLALLGVTFVALIGAAGANDGRAPDRATQPQPTRLDAAELRRLSLELTPRVAARVARLRELGFQRPPVPRLASTEDLRRIAGRQLRRPQVRGELRVADAELRLLGLLGPDESLADVATETTASAAAFYEPRKDRLFVVEDAVPAGPAVTEFILAHELTHALEDDRFGLPHGAGVSDDRMLAQTALVEGTATALMIDYAAIHLDPFALAADVAGIDAGTGGLPRFALDEIDFSYLDGAAFVNELRRIGGDWRLVDLAYRERLPQTTEQILHPAKYTGAEGPLAVPAPNGPQPGWRRLDQGTIGEFATGQILEEGVAEPRAERATAGWGGDAYRLWREPGKGELRGCCERLALAIRWRWDTPRDAREFARALEVYVVEGLGAQRRGGGRWATPNGRAASEVSGDEVALGLAPTGAAATRIADLTR